MNKWGVILVCICVLHCVIQSHGTVWDLGGDWMLYNSDTHSRPIKAHVPGTVYTALYHDGGKTDPYYRYNDDRYRWVAEANWTYYRTFQVSNDLISMKRIELVCDGVDTVADIYVNHKFIGTTKDAFQRYTFDVTHLIVLGENSFTFRFHSPVLYAKNQSSVYKYEVPPNCPPSEQHGWCHVNFIRKPQFSFSWDWAPSFATSGIWRNISLHGFQNIDISYLTVEATKDEGQSWWNITAEVYYTLSGPNFTGRLLYDVPGVDCYSDTVFSLPSPQKKFPIYCIVNVGVKLWWPRGYGDQPLFNLTVTLADETGQMLTTASTRFGFRTIRLVQTATPTTNPGLTFFFFINNYPVFAKGSNWVPADSFQERVTSLYRWRLLQSAADANMNMLRLCAVGIYEHDEFYDIADELGLLIWHDIMGFNCAMYPSDPDFLDTVNKEVTHQVRRLKSHPSIVVWSGNNKNELGLALNLYDTSSNYSLYKSDYYSLYITTIRTTVSKEDSTRVFLSSSPNNGIRSEESGWIAKDPNSTLFGTVDHFEYDQDAWDWRVYPVGRFVTEFGLQSWPSFTSIQSVSEPDDWDYYSEFCQHRQHSVNDNAWLLGNVLLHFKASMAHDSLQRFKDTIYLTQINQAISLRTYAELLRRRQNEAVNSEGYTMGALYWQLQDIWQAPTWASIEYGGRWKMSHYYARRFFNTTILSPYLDVDGDQFTVYYIKDLTPSEPRHTERVLNVIVYSWGSLSPKYSKDISFHQSEDSSTAIYKDSLSELLSYALCFSIQDCFIYLGLDGQLSLGNWFLPSYPNAITGMKNASIKLSMPVQNDNETFAIELKTDAIALFVWLECGEIEGRFSDNGFIMVQPTLSVLFYSWTNITVQQLNGALSVKSLSDLYQ